MVVSDEVVTMLAVPRYGLAFATCPDPQEPRLRHQDVVLSEGVHGEGSVASFENTSILFSGLNW